MPVLTAVIIALAASPSGPTEEGLREYFGGELRESFLFMGAGVASLAVGVPLGIEGRDVGRPMSVPLMVFGAVHLVLGVGLALRTPGQVRALAAMLASDGRSWKELESKRMRGVMSGFQLYRAFELVVGTTGAFMAGLSHVRGEPAVLGVGLGLFIEAAALLALDFFAEERGRKYSALIADFVP